MGKFALGQQVQAQTYIRVRMSPGYVGKSDNTDLITVLLPGEEVTIVGDSTQCDNLTWWNVKPARNEAGWSAECGPDGAVLLAEYDGNILERSLAFVLQVEGGFSIDVDDPGNYVNGVFKGTKYGISANAYPDIDVANLTLEQAKDIFKRDYWYASDADKLTWPLCLAVFDFAVNAGVMQASKTLSQSEYNFERYNDLRRQFYRSLTQFPRYGAAWLARVDALEQYASK